ncbi:M61 family metallopeptidase [Sphingomonas flavalba]|uniref:M61 family metallopeptidase n=1 Tax=Sphingomonas flavalba TaxID=2559804 RepID=UPI0039E1DB1B
MNASLFPLVAMLAAVPVLAVNSAPQPTPIVDTIPTAKDEPYPGTIALAVDATDVTRGIFRVKQTIPVAQAGPMVLLYPKWLPGNHSTTGPIPKLAGLVITAGGQPVPWRRDPVDVYAFHIDVPAGAGQIDLQFQYLSATDGPQGRIQMTPEMLSLQWEKVSLYPAGYFTRRIPIKATATYPDGWTAASGLPSTASGATYSYEATDYETLVDSPTIAGRHYRAFELSPRVTLNVIADTAKELDATPEQIAAHKNLVTQALKLFGTQQYDTYQFLLTISDELGGIGLEHHRSSENGVDPGYFIKWDSNPAERNLLPHEYTHSWNGKFRRPADLWTPDYRTPMQGSLLWVYEGQTQFWGYVLQARSGLVGKQDTLDQLAIIAAAYDNLPARSWRDLVDTTNDPVIAQRRPKGWMSWQRSEDYYNEGLLVWMEIDSILRARSGGKKSMDDFARTFFGIKDGDWGVVTYTLSDVATTLNGIVPYDWADFLNRRLTEHAKGAPLAGFIASGYRLTYTDAPTAAFTAREKSRKLVDLSYSLGLTIGSRDRIAKTVMWDGPAFNAGIDVGTEIVAVNGRAYSDDGIKAAVTAARDSATPIRLLVKNGDRYRELAIDYRDGLRYPRFEKIDKGEGGLDRLLAPKP